MSRKKNFFPVFSILFILALLIFVLSFFGVLNGLSGFFESATVPLQRMTFGLFHFSANINTSNELNSLRDENAKLTTELVKEKTLEKENQALKDQFHTAVPLAQNLLPANIISMSNNQIIIDRGKSDKLKVGDVVVSKDNFVGKISNVSEHISSVDILAKSSSSFTAKTLQTGAIGVINGTDDRVVLNNVVLSDKLQKGDIVITKGDIGANGVGIPANLVVGKIGSVNKKASSLFQSAEVVTLVDFDKLEMVFVLQ